MGEFAGKGQRLDSGFIVAPDRIWKAATGRREAGADRRYGMRWRCPGCGSQIAGNILECLACNTQLIDPRKLHRIPMPFADG